MIGEILLVLATLLFEDSEGAYRAYRSYNYNYYNNYDNYYYNNYDNYYSSSYRKNYNNYYSSSGFFGAIAGGMVGLFLFISIVIVLICCCIKSKARTGRVIVPANNGTVCYISGQPTVSYQRTTMTSGPVAPPPYAYSNPAYPPGAVPQPYPAYPNQPSPSGYPNQAGYPAQNTNQAPPQGYPNQPPPPYQQNNTNPPMPQPEGQGTSNATTPSASAHPRSGSPNPLLRKT